MKPGDRGIGGIGVGIVGRYDTGYCGILPAPEKLVSLYVAIKRVIRGALFATKDFDTEEVSFRSA
jgi:hypothetical protein